MYCVHCSLAYKSCLCLFFLLCKYYMQKPLLHTMNVGFIDAELNLHDCLLLKTPPKEIVRRGFSAVYGYLRRLLMGSSPCKRTKLMMVGLGGAGKTRSVFYFLLTCHHHFTGHDYCSLNKFSILQF